MTRKYTAADFANARFAEHPDGQLAARDTGDPDYPWGTNYTALHDHDMARNGWVPVIPARTIHDRDVEALCTDTASYERDDYLDGFLRGFQQAGGVILDDPEPTNAEKLEKGIDLASRGLVSLTPEQIKSLAEGLEEFGATVKDN